ncbi:hypothetical protein MHY20_00100 [Helcobacillus sp. ACRRO]|uniref:hypothetical protein n=1 Tax=Helcobacillus sp. ACRRO TaxID=2918202 RepID=UPI001EF732A5|nr:hypothetical protein [Helcobacillus sp. ACRRO]MCG7426032.1 hypothetical protein [Helcobacillus sp. ACRRO]
MTFTDLLERMQDGPRKAAEGIAAAYLDGEFTSIDEAARALARVASTSIESAQILGQAACRDILLTIGETPSATAAPLPLVDHARLITASTTCLSTEHTAVMAAGRMVTAELVRAAQDAFHRQMQDSEKVTGWKRGMESSACQLCEWWSREGRVWPKDYPIQTHKGCTCRQIPTTIAIDEFEEVTEEAWKYAEKRKARK